MLFQYRLYEEARLVEAIVQKHWVQLQICQRPHLEMQAPVSHELIPQTIRIAFLMGMILSLTKEKEREEGGKSFRQERSSKGKIVAVEKDFKYYPE